MFLRIRNVLCGGAAVKLGLRGVCLNQDGVLPEYFDQLVGSSVNSLLGRIAQIDYERILLIQLVAVHPAALRLLYGIAAEVANQNFLGLLLCLSLGEDGRVRVLVIGAEIQDILDAGVACSFGLDRSDGRSLGRGGDAILRQII